MPQQLSSKEQFACAACGEDFRHEATVTECRMCHRTFCDECINAQGICVPCEESRK